MESQKIPTEYVYVPYPKWIMADGKTFIVNSKEEHDKYLKKPEPVKPDSEPVKPVQQSQQPSKGNNQQYGNRR